MGHEWGMQNPSFPDTTRGARAAEPDSRVLRRGKVEIRVLDGANSSPDEFDAVFSSDAPLIRRLPVYDEDTKRYEVREVEEVLSHAPGAVDLSRLQGRGGINLLREHYEEVLGRVESAEIVGSQLCGRIRVDVGIPRGQELSGQWARDFNNSLSVGYIINERTEEINPATGNLRITATQWELLELSVVSVSADSNAAVGARSYKFGTQLVGNPQGEKKMDPNTQPAAAAVPPPPPPPAAPQAAPSIRSGETTADTERQLATLRNENTRRDRGDEIMRIYEADPRADVLKLRKIRDVIKSAIDANGHFGEAQDAADKIIRGNEGKRTATAEVAEAQTRVQEGVDNRISLGDAGVWLLANEKSSDGVDVKTRTRHGLVREYSGHLFAHSEFLQRKHNGKHPEDTIFLGREIVRGFSPERIRMERDRQMSTAFALQQMARAGRAFSAQDNPIFTGQTDSDDSAQELVGNVDTMAEQDSFRADLYLPEAKDTLSLERLGLSYLNVSNDIDIPLQNGTLVAGWNSETGRLRDDSFTTSRISTSPERYGLQTNMTTLRRIKDVLPIETIMRSDAVFAMEKLVEQGLINGTGTANQITGLLRWSGIPSYNEPGNANNWNLTINNLLLMQENFNIRNEVGPFGLLLTPRLQTIARTLPIGILDAPSDSRLLPIASGGGRILEHPYETSSYMPTNGTRGSHTAADLHSLVMGRFNELFRIDYGPIRIGTDPYSAIDRSLTKFIWEGFTASLVRNTDAFLISTAINSTL